jgi:fatty-acyl-CoA synthase
MPLFHTTRCGLATLGALQTGGVHVLPPGAEPGPLLELIEFERGTHVLCVPTMLVRLLDHPDLPSRDLSSWRLCTIGGAPVAPELVRRARERTGVEVAIGYGPTEASPYVTHTHPRDPHPD